MSDYEVEDEDWVLSEASEEDFSDAGGANENGEWPVEIVGEEVTYSGEVLFEARWGNWSRGDGTNTTLDNRILGPDQTRRWASKQKKKRQGMAAESIDIDIWTTLDIHNRETRLRAQAYEEKEARAKKMSCDLAERMAKNLADKGFESKGPLQPVGRHLRLTPARRQTTVSLRSSGSSSSLREPTPASPSSSSTKLGRPESTPMTSISPIPAKEGRTGPLGALRDTPASVSSSSTKNSRPTSTPMTSVSPRSAKAGSTVFPSASSSMRESPASTSSPSMKIGRPASTPVASASRLPVRAGSISSPLQGTPLVGPSGTKRGRPASIPETYGSTFSVRAGPILSSSLSSPLQETPSASPASKKRDRPASVAMTSGSLKRTRVSNTVAPSHTSSSIRPSPFGTASLFSEDDASPKKRPLSPQNLLTPQKKRRGQPPANLSPAPSLSSDIVEIPMPPPSRSKKQVTTPTSSTPVLSEKACGKLPAGRTTTSQSSSSANTSSSTNSLSTKTRNRLTVQAEWNKIIRRSHAAPVTFVNEIDDEELPLLPPNFQYIENGYYDPDKLKPDYSDFFTVCDCTDCVSASSCGCQDASKAFKGDDKIFAYTQDGLYSFKVHRSIEVIECNKKCACSADCPNRVAQKPRDIPIEVFKTKNRGWGTRSPVDVPKGKVLGIYSGKLITREAAAGMSKRLAAYCFDLDGFEFPDEDAPEGACTIDARACGNWMRFINHSCLPNLNIYSVVYDTIPETHHPYIAFIAKKNIPAHTEFTFDYLPHAKSLKPNKKGKVKLPEGAKRCLCESTSCRGYYTL